MLEYTGRYQEALIEAIEATGNALDGVFVRDNGDVLSGFSFKLTPGKEIRFSVDGNEYNSPSDYLKWFQSKYGGLHDAVDPSYDVLGGSFHVYRKMLVELAGVGKRTMEQILETYGAELEKGSVVTKKVKREKITANMHAREGLFKRYGNNILMELSKIHGKDQVCKDADYMLLGQFETKYGL